MSKISHCLWFDGQAEEAANLYVSIFKDGKISHISRYGKEGYEIHGRPAGSVMTVEFEIAGQKYTALNGGPQFKFNEAFSIMVTCENQDEVDYFWSRLTENGGQEGPCGWLKDKFGVYWQIAPKALFTMLSDSDPTKVARVTKAFLSMKKFDVKALEKAFKG